MRASKRTTRWLSASDVAQLVQQLGIDTVFSGLVDYLAADFQRWPQFDKVPRVPAFSPRGVIELMPIADAQYHAFKYVNGHPENGLAKVPTVMAYGALAEVATGFPLLLSELTIATALRTAATSALAARHLARRDSRVMAIIGNGAQSEFQALAFHHLLGIERVRVFDIDPAATDKFVANLADVRELTIERASSVADAVQGVDVVTLLTAAQRQASVLTESLLAPGLHLNAVGGDSPRKTELASAVLDRCQVFVEFEPQSRVEGEVQQAAADFPVVELWRVVSGDHPGRRSAGEITLFDSVGFALEDFSTLRYLRDQSERLGLGQTLQLVPSLANPKDLYSLLGLTRARQTRSKMAAIP